MTEAERKAFNDAVLDALEGLHITVKGSFIGDEMVHVLARKGAQSVVDMLKARDFRIVRVPD